MIIEGKSVAECWLAILNNIVKTKRSEISPLIIKINVGDGPPIRFSELEMELNGYLKSVGQPCIETTAGTIFPDSLYEGERSIYDRYESVWEHVRSVSKNRRGTYFRRLTAYGDGSGKKVNQLREIIETYNGTESRNPVHRRSALIATIFDPLLDHTHQPQLGFPCLQQVCFIPNRDGELSMNAIYAMQHLSTRAYGNYLGLIRLGQFMAKEMNLKFTHLNCMVSILNIGKMSKKLASEIIVNYGEGL